MTEPLRPLTPEARRNVGRFLYCHHHGGMVEMEPLGWAQTETRRGFSTLVYRCTCGAEVRLEPRRI